MATDAWIETGAAEHIKYSEGQGTDAIATKPIDRSCDRDCTLRVDHSITVVDASATNYCPSEITALHPAASLKAS